MPPASPSYSPIISWQMQRGLLTLRSPAKVNLFLHIRDQRGDGYYNLVSLMAKVDCFDEITLERLETPGIELACPGHAALEGPDNLIYRAAQAMLPRGLGIALTLKKQIPMGAGLGGGSGNAGITIFGLNQLFGLNLPLSAQARLGAKLGADVPFFLEEATFAMARGTGTELRALTRLPQLHLVLVHPGFGVATAWAYQAYARAKMIPKTLTLSNRNDKEFDYSRVKSSNSSLLACLAKMMRNDLEPVVIAAHPRIGEIKRSLMEVGAVASLMSGSGSSVMGLFAGSEEAQQAAKEMTARTGLWCHAVRTL